LIGLLEDPRVALYDVIAVQEPWRNSHDSAMYNPRNSPFYLVDAKKAGSRVSTYVNKKIPLSSWQETFHSDDLHSVTLRIEDGIQGSRIINIHNMYNPPPRSHNENEDLGTLVYLPQATRMPGEHIILGDFNLHHPLWAGPSYPHQHILADNLLEQMRNAGAQLALPQGTITRDIRKNNSTERTTIDLIFATEALQDSILSCDVAHGLEQSSDHLPISTEFEWDNAPIPQAKRQRRAWKKLDETKFMNSFSESAETLTALPLTTHEDTNNYAEALTHAINVAIEASTPWSRLSEHSKSFWTPECEQAVKTTRHLRRVYTRERTEEAWEAYTKEKNRKGKVLAKARRTDFRQAMRKAGEKPEGIWGIVKWARQRSQGKTRQVTIPTLKRDARVAQDIRSKAELLRDTHFPPPPEADLSDIPGFAYPTPLEVPAELSLAEVKRAILKTKKDNAPGPDEIPNRVIHLIIRTSPATIMRLFQACMDQGVHPEAFKKATTVIIRKDGDRDYSNPEAYRPIALLNTLGKALEAVVSNRIRFLAETHALLPDTQMGARRMRSTDTALQLITEKIHAIWGSNRYKVASLLSLDVSGAFDRVSHTRLIHNLRKRRIPESLLNWTQSFLTNRSTELRINDFILPESRVSVGIPQGSPISPVLYLFYNADLLEACENIRLRTSATGFVDDVNILTHSSSTEQNCITLKIIHSACEEWAKRHGSSFAKKKFHLIHFTRTLKRVNLEASLNLGEHTVEPETDIRILGVQLDTTLRWQPHLRAVEAQVTHHVNALKAITGSTWGAPMETARKAYCTTVRPAIIFGCNAWYTPAGTKGYRKGIAVKLQSIQGKCLRAIAGAYKATSTEALEIETYIPPLDLFTEESVARTSTRLRTLRTRFTTQTAVERIQHQTRGSRGRRSAPVITPAATLREWTEKRVGDLSQIEKRIPYAIPPWATLPTAEIANSKDTARMNHDNDSHALRLRVYTDGSGLNDRITASAVSHNAAQTCTLGTKDDAQVYHGELAGIEQATRMLLKDLTDPSDPTPKTAVIYTDNQAALRALVKGDPTKDQAMIRNIVLATEALTQRKTTLLLRWIPGHAKIAGNEMADQKAKQTASVIGPTKPPETRYLSAIYGRIRQHTAKKWKLRWAQGTKGDHVRQLNSEPSPTILKLHTGREKAHSAILTQLRTGKIGFNAFLHERRVPTVPSPRCPCDLGAMTVRHVLLTCPIWKDLRDEYIRPLQSTNLSNILNSPKGCTAVILFILHTQLLEQFKGVASESLANSQRITNNEAELTIINREP